MLLRSQNLVRLFQNIGYFNPNESCILKVALIKRHSSILTKVYRLNITSNTFSKFENIYCGNIYNDKWHYITGARFSSDDGKSKSKFSKKSNIDATIDPKVQVIKLDGEELGELKERVLEVPLAVENSQNTSIIEKIPIEAAATETETDKSKVEASDSKPVVKRTKVDRTVSSLERNFITPVRAMTDFLLKPSDLETLPKTKRRSPYEYEPPITVYWRKDVEAKANEVWGSREALLKELLRKELEKKTYQQNVFTVKRRLRDYRREIGNKAEINHQEGLFGRSGKVVLTAVIINACNFLFKFFAWIYTGSHSMFSECIHSAADTCNQLILAYGIQKSIQNPNPDHPYGYTNMKYVSSLISGVGIFCVGTGLSVYHGIQGLLFPQPVDSFYWAYFILGGSLASEGATLVVAINSIKRGAEEKAQNFKDYVLAGLDPSVNVVLMEDFAAVIGIIIAATCMGLTSCFGNPIYDSIGSLLVGGLLGGIASFIIYSNVAALVGRSISQENLNKINAELESDIMVRAIHDVKGIDMGNSLVRYKAELDFDGRELTRSYLDKHDLSVMLEEVKKMETIDELECFLLKHGENIVDMLGGEIDRIELKLKKNHPEIRHCDLEIL